jgi:hypothetical protein
VNKEFDDKSYGKCCLTGSARPRNRRSRQSVRHISVLFTFSLPQSQTDPFLKTSDGFTNLIVNRISIGERSTQFAVSDRIQHNSNQISHSQFWITTIKLQQFVDHREVNMDRGFLRVNKCSWSSRSSWSIDSHISRFSPDMRYLRRYCEVTLNIEHWLRPIICYEICWCPSFMSFFDFIEWPNISMQLEDQKGVPSPEIPYRRTDWRCIHSFLQHLLVEWIIDGRGTISMQECPLRNEILVTECDDLRGVYLFNMLLFKSRTISLPRANSSNASILCDVRFPLKSIGFLIECWWFGWEFKVESLSGDRQLERKPRFNSYCLVTRLIPLALLTTSPSSDVQIHFLLLFLSLRNELKCWNLR